MDIPYSVYLFILMEIWVIFTFWLLRIMLLWTYMYKFLCGHMFSFLLGIYLGVELLDHMVSLCLTFWGTSKLYPKQLCNFTFPPAMCEGSNFSTSSLTLFIVHLFAYSHLSGYEVVALCGLCLDFLLTKDIDYLSCAYWPFVYLLWRNVYLDPLPNFNWVICLILEL